MFVYKNGSLRTGHLLWYMLSYHITAYHTEEINQINVPATSQAGSRMIHWKNTRHINLHYFSSGIKGQKKKKTFGAPTSLHTHLLYYKRLQEVMIDNDEKVTPVLYRDIVSYTMIYMVNYYFHCWGSHFQYYHRIYVYNFQWREYYVHAWGILWNGSNLEQ